MLVLVQCIKCNRWFPSCKKECICEKHELLFRAETKKDRVVFVFVTEQFGNGSVKKVQIELYAKSTNPFSVEEHLMRHDTIDVEKIGNWIYREGP